MNKNNQFYFHTNKKRLNLIIEEIFHFFFAYYWRLSHLPKKSPLRNVYERFMPFLFIYFFYLTDIYVHLRIISLKKGSLIFYGY
jgi:hypothetical protein